MKTTVASSMIAAISYNQETFELIVHWVRGGQTSYYNVPQEVHDKFIASDSVGQFYNQNIKGKYADPSFIPEPVSNEPIF
jgi:hypothetical protein